MEEAGQQIGQKGMQNKLALFGLFFFSMLVSGILAELVAALAAPNTLVTHDILGRKLEVLDFPKGSDPYCATFAPGSVAHHSLHGVFSYSVHTNSLGIRNREVDPTSEFRILILGDSQTMGVGLQDNETYPAQLEKILTEKTKKRVQVINAGIPGYSTREELCLLKRLGPQIKPNLVLLGFHVDNALVPDQGNDLVQNFQSQRQTASAPITASLSAGNRYGALGSFLQTHSHLYGLLSVVKKRLLRVPDHAQNIAAYQRNPANIGELDSAWNLSGSLLKEVESYTRNTLHANLVVVHIPGPASLINNENGAEAKLRATGLPLIPVFESLQSIRGGNIRNVCFAEGHYIPRAAKQIANDISVNLEKHFPGLKESKSALRKEYGKAQ